MTDDGFELWDLRIEVVAPEGGAIYCGAKPGDWFELRGEMLFLPPGQGISIYSLASVLPLLAAKPRPCDARSHARTRTARRASVSPGLAAAGSATRQPLPYPF